MKPHTKVYLSIASVGRPSDSKDYGQVTVIEAAKHIGRFMLTNYMGKHYEIYIGRKPMPVGSGIDKVGALDDILDAMLNEPLVESFDSEDDDLASLESR